MKNKFDNVDRQLVLRHLKKIIDRTLLKVGTSKIYFHDNSGSYYCILGGIDYWHGIPKEIIDSKINSYDEAFLVFAKKYRHRIELFMESIQPVIKNRGRLNFNNEKYFFNIKSIESNYLSIRELPNYHLKKIGEFSYSDKTRESVRKSNELNKLFQNMSEDELEKSIKLLEDHRKVILSQKQNVCKAC